MKQGIAPAIRFSLGDYRLIINAAVLACLGNPAYLQFLFEDERKLLAISGSVEKINNSYKVPDRTYQKVDDDCRICRLALTEAFRRRMNWDKKDNYRIVGEYSPDIGMVVFDLNRAVKTNKDAAE